MIANILSFVVGAVVGVAALIWWIVLYHRRKKSAGGGETALQVAWDAHTYLYQIGGQARQTPYVRAAARWADEIEQRLKRLG